MKNFLGSRMSRCKGSEVRKGLMFFSEKLKRSQVVKRLWTCLRWGWSSRQGHTRHIWKPLKGSPEEDRHRIRPPRLLLESGLQGASKELETSQETIWVALMTYAQWLWWWEKSGYIWDTSWRYCWLDLVTRCGEMTRLILEFLAWTAV